MKSEMPRVLPVATAAIIVGRSREAFLRDFVESGQVDAELTAGGRVVVVTEALERKLGCEITYEEYMAAGRKRDAARQYQQNYRNQRRVGDAANIKVSSGARAA